MKHKLWLKENVEIEEEEKDVIGDDQTTLQHLWLSNVNKRRIRESDLVVIDLIYITTEMCIIHNFLFILWANYYSAVPLSVIYRYYRVYFLHE